MKFLLRSSPLRKRAEVKVWVFRTTHCKPLKRGRAFNHCLGVLLSNVYSFWYFQSQETHFFNCRTVPQLKLCIEIGIIVLEIMWYTLPFLRVPTHITRWKYSCIPIMSLILVPLQSQGADCCPSQQFLLPHSHQAPKTSWKLRNTSKQYVLFSNKNQKHYLLLPSEYRSIIVQKHYSSAALRMLLVHDGTSCEACNRHHPGTIAPPA